MRCLGALILIAASTANAQVDTAQLKALRFRYVGPTRGGRVTTVTGVPQEPRTFYMGSTGGGVWKTTNAGVTWSNISDGFFKVASIGSIDVSDSNPNIIYVGTGSEGLRSNVSVGRGIYKSSDAGKTWKFMGLRDGGQIGSVAVNPTNPDIAFAAALGNPFGRNTERGIYRTTDGGASWKKVLFISDSTGGVDVELQPGNPNVIYAAMWRGERKPWTIISGAREGGIYKSTDGGDTWNRLGGGLPSGLVGKANIAVTAANPQRVYVLIEAAPGSGLYRSDDAGASFIPVDTTTRGLITRPFYYTNITADPRNENVVYVGAEGYYKSTDGGRSWSSMSTPHGDNHDLWINPNNSSIMIQSNDGGANVSLDGGATWSTQYNQPTAEMYQVYVDNQYPYRLYGAQQDNNSELVVTSLPFTESAPEDPIMSYRPAAGCESGPVVPHLTNPDTIYGGCKGNFSRYSQRTGQEKNYAIGQQSLYGNAGKDLIYRFQRVGPIETSPHDPRVVYAGSQYLHRTRDEGVNWERISPDLTWNPAERQQKVSGEPITIDVTGEEYYSTLYAIRESPVQKGLIWTGANDGPFNVTRDNGKTWKNVTPKGQPAGCRVQNIEPSPHRAATAYYAVLCYLLGDFHPYIWRTDDFGSSWTLLTPGTNGIPADFPTRVVREDPARAGLLYAGTEFGLFMSFDNGGRWQPLQLNLPITPVTDMKIHRNDMVLSTQGRGFWILDDLTPLQQLGLGTIPARHLLKTRTAYRYHYPSQFGGGESSRLSSGDPQYIPSGAVINYWLSDKTAPVKLEILDATQKVIRVFSSEVDTTKYVSQNISSPRPSLESAGGARLSKSSGLNRFIWDLAMPGPWDATARNSGRRGPMAAPGTYTVRLTTGDIVETQPLKVEADPRVARDGITTEILREQLAHNLRVRDLVTDVNLAVARIGELKKTFAGNAVTVARLNELEGKLVTPPIRYSKPGLQAHIQYLYFATNGADQKVGRDAVERYNVLRKELDSILVELKQIDVD
jgi:photosystem II stability/assembly factor-like uncharacterized protein